MRKKSVKRKQIPVLFDFEEAYFKGLAENDFKHDIFENYHYIEVKTPIGKIRYDKFRDTYYVY